MDCKKCKYRKPKYKLRITKCYLVEVVDENGYVHDYCQDGRSIEASDYCFGTKEDAIKTGNELIKWVEESEEERG